MARFHHLLRGAALLGASALVASCSVMTPIQTAELYNAGDGVRVEVTEELRAENLMVLSEEEGGEGQVFGSLVNDTEEDVVMSLTIGDGGIQVPVPATDHVVLGVDEIVVVPSVPVPPGANAEGLVEASGHGTVSANVPVLDSTLPQYADYVP
ncbi:hypothetical protein SAMN05216184_102270 [Georgenia satyanarayanai]|uniref:Lipoprotein n=1 Tax=Georgenia satyanarayanai TaxID=860221 RepID=A0A2Y9A7I4_9MICO|nr:hypothetical protein [Georgenia satyanarayanai]PYG01109.1 hypothetical protein A8987_102270 [Georgenia satyanarayanai]SSA39348.1 hypothetical protein SAMN05216184_102270 [Georgenia satyanarayanai]